MNYIEKNNELKQIIKNKLSPFVSGKCCLLGLPYYHENIGDFLIWEGVELFLKDVGVNCVYRASALRYDPKRIYKNMTILINGGGSFGDVWENAIRNWRQIVNDFPNNKIVILPQTVFYSDHNVMLADADLFGHHPNLILCARDNRSFNTLRLYFHLNTILLIPDMAFYMSNSPLLNCKKKSSNKILFLKRKDKELNNDIDFSFLEKSQIDSMDWITYDKNTFYIKLIKKYCIKKRNPLIVRFIDFYIYFFYKNYIIKLGVLFFADYIEVFTTRLHGAILSCLMQKYFILFDNSYGKNKLFFETWLGDLEKSKLYSQAIIKQSNKISFLVSIIIPLYNKEEYFERCFNSVCIQTYKNIECVIVEDCSTDNSLKIAENLIQNYTGNIYFRLIKHNQNNGLSGARNTGIYNSTGDFLYFLDADDEITDNAIKSLVMLLEKFPNAEISQGNMYQSPRVQYDSYDQKGKLPQIIKGNLEINKFYYHSGLLVNAVNKLIKRDFIIKNNLYFKLKLIHEDYHWFFFVLKKINTIVFTDEYCYIRYFVPGSIITNDNYYASISSYLAIVQDRLYNLRIELFDEQLSETLQLLKQQKEKILSNERYSDLLPLCNDLLEKIPNGKFFVYFGITMLIKNFKNKIQKIKELMRKIFRILFVVFC